MNDTGTAGGGVFDSLLSQVSASATQLLDAWTTSQVQTINAPAQQAPAQMPTQVKVGGTTFNTSTIVIGVAVVVGIVLLRGKAA